MGICNILDRLFNMPTCFCCNLDIEQHKAVSCNACQRTYQYSCVGLTTSEVRTISTKPNLSWSCTTCVNSTSGMDELKSMILDLKNEIAGLRSQIDTAKRASSCTCDFEKIISEINDRQKRKCNLMFFGVAETSGATKDERAANEKQLVVDVVKFLTPTIRTDFTRITRLGKYDSNRRSARPIKVTLDSEDLVHQIIKNSRRLRESQSYRHINVSVDRTPTQNEYYRGVRQELKDRTDGGETGLRIKYVRGLPTIVNSEN